MDPRAAPIVRWLPPPLTEHALWGTSLCQWPGLPYLVQRLFLGLGGRRAVVDLEPAQ